MAGFQVTTEGGEVTTGQSLDPENDTTKEADPRFPLQRFAVGGTMIHRFSIGPQDFEDFFVT